MFSFSQEINRNSHYQTNLAYLNWIPLRKCNDLLILKVNDMNWIESIWHILWNKIIKSTRCMWLSARFLACSSRTSFNCSRSSFAEWVIKTRSIIAGCPIVLKMRDLITFSELLKLFQKIDDCPIIWIDLLQMTEIFFLLKIELPYLFNSS